MRWSNVLVIFGREVRDQVRDRRTLFMIFVLPILLYPILGISATKLSEFYQDVPRTVVVVGAEHLPGSNPGGAEGEPATTPLLNEARDGFNPELFSDPGDAARLRVRLADPGSPWTRPEARRALLRARDADAVVIVPPGLGTRLAELGRTSIPIYYNSADERSQITFLRVDRLVERWKELIVERRREAEGKPEGYTDPVRSKAEDVATASEAGSTVWAKIFPFLLVMMALTGAFYPAVDLCAGEKERGTMETLLISPASRAEIVVGKFLTVMLASIATALLNLLSMGLTAWQMAAMFGGGDAGRAGAAARAASSPLLVAPSFASAGWMILLLIPLAAFFSAICLALAVMARSMKEGQYYMTPLYLVALPLIFITLVPGITLTPLTSLVPITGVSLLLKSLMLGEYGVARRYFPAVMVPILVYGVIALWWAIDQFKSESVLFREAERFDLRSWLRHLWRDKRPTPGPAQAILCFALMLATAWFLMPYLGTSLYGMAAMQVGVILAPPVLLAILLTSDPGRTLRLRIPALPHLLLGVALALTLNPFVNELRIWVESLFPTPEPVRKALEHLQAQFSDLGSTILLLALAPAICEEVAFRGYILSGLQRGQRTRSAIFLSAFLFGFMHVLLSLFQQLFNATVLGVVLGLLAVRSASLVPGIAFHFINNALGVLTGMLLAEPALRRVAAALYRDPSRGVYHWYWVVLGALGSVILLRILYRLPNREPAPTRDEFAGEPVAGPA